MSRSAAGLVLLVAIPCLMLSPAAVAQAPVIDSVTFGNLTGVAPQTVAFTVHTRGGVPTSYLWTFFDDEGNPVAFTATNTQTQPVTFANDDTYGYRVTVMNSSGMDTSRNNNAITIGNIRAFTITGNVTTGLTFDFYLDFGTATSPPVCPSGMTQAQCQAAVTDPMDHFLRVTTTADGNSTAAAAQAVVAAANTALRLISDDLDRAACPRTSSESSACANDGTVEFLTSQQLTNLYASTTAGGTLNSIPAGGSISINPTLTDTTPTTLAAEHAGPNAHLRVNGRDPGRHAARTIEVVVPGMLAIEITSGTNANAGFILAAGTDHAPGALMLPWGGSFDLAGGIVILGDGIGFSVNPLIDGFYTTGAPAGHSAFDFSVSLGAAVDDSRLTLQGVVMDVLNPPFFLDNTQVADVLFEIGQEGVLATGDDGVLPLAFTTGKTFPFYGTSYTGCFVSGNGFMTFGAATGLAGGGFVIDPVAALATEPPAIYVNWADWNPNTVPSAGVFFREFGAEVRFKWGVDGRPMSRFAQVDESVFVANLHLDIPAGTGPMNQAEITDDPGSIHLNYVSLEDRSVPDPAASFDCVIGISPGMGLDPTPVSRDLGERYETTSAFEAIIEQHATGAGATGVASVLPTPNGGTQVYHNGRSLNGRTIGIYPNQTVPGHHVIATSPKPSDLRGADTTTISASMGSTFNLIGQFRHIFSPTVGAPAPVALLSAAGMGTAPLMILNIMDDNVPPQTLVPSVPTLPGFRNFEGLGVASPPFPAPLAGLVLDIILTFPSGATFTLPAAVTLVP